MRLSARSWLEDTAQWTWAHWDWRDVGSLSARAARTAADRLSSSASVAWSRRSPYATRSWQADTATGRNSIVTTEKTSMLPCVGTCHGFPLYCFIYCSNKKIYDFFTLTFSLLGFCGKVIFYSNWINNISVTINKVILQARIPKTLAYAYTVIWNRKRRYWVPTRSLISTPMGESTMESQVLWIAWACRSSSN